MVTLHLFSRPSQCRTAPLILQHDPTSHPFPSRSPSIPPGEPSDVPAALARLAAALKRVEKFYHSVGGIAGYHATSLDLIIGASEALRTAAALQTSHQQGAAAAATAALPGSPAPLPEVTFHVPRGLDLAGEGGRQLGGMAAACGLAAMPFMAEIYPVGGASAEEVLRRVGG